MNKIPIKDTILVSIQALLFVLFVFWEAWSLGGLPRWGRFMGMSVTIMGCFIIILAMVQLNQNLSPFPTPKVQSQLVTKGLYRYVRHPIYTGILLVMIGYGFFSAQISRLLIAGITYILFYVKSDYEEKLLLQKFPEYVSYMKRTGKIWPIRSVSI